MSTGISRLSGSSRAGFTHLALVQVGNDQQAEFISWAASELLPGPGSYSRVFVFIPPPSRSVTSEGVVSNSPATAQRTGRSRPAPPSGPKPVGWRGCCDRSLSQQVSVCRCRSANSPSSNGRTCEEIWCRRAESNPGHFFLDFIPILGNRFFTAAFTFFCCAGVPVCATRASAFRACALSGIGYLRLPGRANCFLLSFLRCWVVRSLATGDPYPPIRPSTPRRAHSERGVGSS